MGRVVQLELLALSRLYLFICQRTGVEIFPVCQRLTIGNIDAVLILLIFDLIQGDRAVGGVAAELDALDRGKVIYLDRPAEEIRNTVGGSALYIEGAPHDLDGFIRDKIRCAALHDRAVLYEMSQLR